MKGVSDPGRKPAPSAQGSEALGVKACPETLTIFHLRKLQYDAAVFENDSPSALDAPNGHAPIQTLRPVARVPSSHQGLTTFWRRETPLRIKSRNCVCVLRLIAPAPDRGISDSDDKPVGLRPCPDECAAVACMTGKVRQRPALGGECLARSRTQVRLPNLAARPSLISRMPAAWPRRHRAPGLTGEPSCPRHAAAQRRSVAGNARPPIRPPPPQKDLRFGPPQFHRPPCPRRPGCVRRFAIFPAAADNPLLHGPTDHRHKRPGTEFARSSPLPRTSECEIPSKATVRSLQLLKIETGAKMLAGAPPHRPLLAPLPALKILTKAVCKFGDPRLVDSRCVLFSRCDQGADCTMEPSMVTLQSSRAGPPVQGGAISMWLCIPSARTCLPNRGGSCRKLFKRM